MEQEPEVLQVGATGVRTDKAVLTCDYNGWNDAPEEEREWFDQHPEIWSGVAPSRTTDNRPLRIIGKWFNRTCMGRMAA